MSLGCAVPARADDDQQADTSSSFFSVSAASSPVGVEFFDAGAPVIPGEIVYASATATKAAVDSVGNSAGFAAGPYLGDNVPALMGAFNALGPAGPILPPYPFMVASQYPGTPKQVQDSGPRHLAATSSENSSDADAHVGLARGNPALLSVSSTSVAKQDPATGLLTATADGTVEAFSVGPTLTIGQLISHAEVTGRPGERPAKKTTLSIGSLTVMGTLVGLTDKGLVPVPGTPKTADLNSLTKQLAATGLTLGLLPGEDTDAGTDSAALVIGIARDFPGHGLVRVRVILGRVRARVESGAPPAQG
jgi:hypothetical protein